MATWTEYHVRELDAEGEALNVNLWDTLREAREDFNAGPGAKYRADGCVALDLEKCVTSDREGVSPIFKTIATS